MGKIKDLTGQIYDKLTVIKIAEKPIDKKQNGVYWLCKCLCGNEVVVFAGDLTKKNRPHSCRSCACSNLLNKKFERLTVIKRYNKSLGKWWCQCDCGNPELICVKTNELTHGLVKSCGCLKKEIISELGKQFKKYNDYDLSREYGIGWTSNTNKEFYFDLEDYDKIKDYCWYESDNEYIKTKINQEMILLHRFLVNPPNDMVVDHINHNKQDNRKNNLRIGTYSNNSMNKRILDSNTSGTTGVSYNLKNDCWVCQIQFDNNRITKDFTNKQDAINARKELEQKYFGEWSYENSMKQNQTN